MTAPLWRKPNGDPIACVEKLKVLRENLDELQQLVKDALEDALLMGCSEACVREAFHKAVDATRSDFPEQRA